MATVPDSINLALDEADRLRKLLKKKSTPQVWSGEERAIIKANVLAWFNNHRAACTGLAALTAFKTVDGYYRQLLESAERATSRKTYERILKLLRTDLITIRSEAMVQPAAASTTDQAPSFAPLIADVSMQKILLGRWNECLACIGSGAPLAATVMMGGLLEALLLARVHRESNQAPIYTAIKAPRDKAGKTKSLNEWGLQNYIDVGHELGWITISARSVGEVLRDYRNYVHPHKQLSNNVHLTSEDAQLLWEVSKAISRQVISSARP